MERTTAHLQTETQKTVIKINIFIIWRKSRVCLLMLHPWSKVWFITCLDWNCRKRWRIALCLAPRFYTQVSELYFYIDIYLLISKQNYEISTIPSFENYYLTKFWKYNGNFHLSSWNKNLIKYNKIK